MFAPFAFDVYLLRSGIVLAVFVFLASVWLFVRRFVLSSVLHLGCFVGSFLSFFWCPIFTVAVIGMFPWVSFHVVLLGPFGMHVLFLAAGVGPAHVPMVSLHYVIILELMGAPTYITVGS